MDHKMRRRDRETSPECARKLLADGEYGILSTVDAHGQPYGVPLSYALLEDALYFHSALKGHKLQNILHEPKVSFCVVANTQPVYDGSFTTNYDSVVVFGKALLVEDEAERAGAFKALCLKYLPQHMDKFADSMKQDANKALIYKIAVGGMTGKARHPAAHGEG